MVYRSLPRPSEWSMVKGQWIMHKTAGMIISSTYEHGKGHVDIIS